MYSDVEYAKYIKHVHRDSGSGLFSEHQRCKIANLYH